MRASVFSHPDLIGHTDLKIGDKSMGCVYGDFFPNDLYYHKIQQRVWEFIKTGNPGIWSGLRLNVQLDNGFFLFPNGGYDLMDSPDFPEEPKRIDIAGNFRHVIEDFFLAEAAAPIFKDPWRPLSISGKIALEDELRKEIGEEHPSRIANILTRPHVLTGFEFSAVAVTGQSDDVLFAVHSPTQHHKEYAVVHLTWKRAREENTAFPNVDFYKSFEEFTLTRMYPDHKDWL